MPTTMRTYLRDEAPVYMTEDGKIVSPFPFEMIEAECPKCHEPLVTLCGIRACASCPVISDWLKASRDRLQTLKTQLEVK